MNDIPLVYKKMVEAGLTKFKGGNYLWLNDMEWVSSDKLKKEEYVSEDIIFVIEFAFTGGGDQWVWVANNINSDYYVGIHYTEEEFGRYYAKNMQDAILKHIIEYVSDSNFYLGEKEAECLEISEKELKELLYNWSEKFQGIIKDEYIDIIKDLSKLNLKKVTSIYGEWYALLSLEECCELVDKFTGFELENKEF